MNSKSKYFIFGDVSKRNAIVESASAMKKLFRISTADERFQLFALILFIAPSILIINVKDVKK